MSRSRALKGRCTAVAAGTVTSPAEAGLPAPSDGRHQSGHGRRSSICGRAFIAWIINSFPLSKTSTTTSSRRPWVSNPKRSWRAGFSSSRSSIRVAPVAAWIAPGQRAEGLMRGRSHSGSGERLADDVGARLPVPRGARVEFGDLLPSETQRHHLRRRNTPPGPSSPALLQRSDIEAFLGLGSPSGDLLLSDRPAVDCLVRVHRNNVLRNTLRYNEAVQPVAAGPIHVWIHAPIHLVFVRFTQEMADLRRTRTSLAVPTWHPCARPTSRLVTRRASRRGCSPSPGQLARP